MPMLPDARFDDPLLNDAFDFSRYPNFKTRNAKSSEPRHRVRERVAASACPRVTDRPSLEPSVQGTSQSHSSYPQPTT